MCNAALLLVPRGAADTVRQRNALQYLDCGNVIGSAASLARRVGVELPYASWLVDHHSAAGQVARVYAYRLAADERPASPPPLEQRAVGSGSYRWVAPAELVALQPSLMRHGGREVRWHRMWVREEDERGEKCLRTIGFAHPPYNRMLAGSYNGPGNAVASYVVGRRTVVPGQIVPPPPKPA